MVTHLGSLVSPVTLEDAENSSFLFTAIRERRISLFSGRCANMYSPFCEGYENTLCGNTCLFHLFRKFELNRILNLGDLAFVLIDGNRLILS